MRDRELMHDLYDDKKNNQRQIVHTHTHTKRRRPCSLQHPIRAIKDQLGRIITPAARMHVSPLD